MSKARQQKPKPVYIRRPATDGFYVFQRTQSEKSFFDAWPTADFERYHTLRLKPGEMVRVRLGAERLT